jgi:hypothetical protein
VRQHEDRGMMMNILLVPQAETNPAKYFAEEMKRNAAINQEING